LANLKEKAGKFIMIGAKPKLPVSLTLSEEIFGLPSDDC
jgi:hypothetical protein